MEALQQTFMLLPNFSFLPTGPVQLGSILPKSDQTKRPDPRRLLNRANIHPVSSISTQNFEPWTWDSDKEVTQKAGVFAEIALLTGIGGAIEGERGRISRLLVSCEKVEQETFFPDPTYIAKAVAAPTIQAILKKASRPSIFLVTGRMVACKASVTVERERSFGTNNKIEADGSQVAVPLRVGGEFGFGNKERSTLDNVPTEPFVLAYQLVRIRRRLFSDEVQERDENQWALFDDSRKGQSKDADELLKNCEVDIISSEMNWED